MAQANFCTGCGEKLGTNDKFCASCGNEVAIKTSEPEPAAIYEPATQLSGALNYFVKPHSFKEDEWVRRINIANVGSVISILN